MGKKIVVIGADFHENAISGRKYIYGISDAIFNSTTRNWVMTAAAFALKSQSALQGKTLDGVRIFVNTAGSAKVYKASSPNVTSSSSMTEVATLSYSGGTGVIADIPFSTPITLGANEYLIFANPSGTDTLLAGYASSSGSQLFYYRVGKTNVTEDGTSLDIDFFQDE